MMESVSFLPVFCLRLHKNVIKFHKEQNQTSKDFIVFKKMGYLFSVVLLCKCSLNRLMLNLYSLLSASAVHIVVIALLFYYYNIYCFIFRKIRELPGLTSFDRVRMFMDTDFSITDQFTVSHSRMTKNKLIIIILLQALGNFYFFHSRLKSVKIWNFSREFNIHVHACVCTCTCISCQ